ncbi:hypothetical protein GGI11_008662, partial [Coemansia sp. RSA 2049]
EGSSSNEARQALGDAVSGRLSFGGEAYYGVQESSGGISLGGRYRHDLPLLSELTCVVNPIMGHMSLAWAQQMRPRLCAAARYNFNAFSLSSDLAAGLEWQLDDSSIVKARWNDSQGLLLLLDAHLSNMVFSMGIALGGADAAHPLAASNSSSNSNTAAGATAMGIGKAPLSPTGIRRFTAANTTTASSLHTPTPLLYSTVMSKQAGCNIWLKLENMQPTQSFKLRGVGNMCAKAVLEHNAKRFVAVGDTNAALAVSYSGRQLGIPVVVFVPAGIQPSAVRPKIELEGAELIEDGRS